MGLLDILKGEKGWEEDNAFMVRIPTILHVRLKISLNS